MRRFARGARRPALAPRFAVIGLLMLAALTGCGAPGAPGLRTTDSRQITTASDETEIGRRANVRMQLALAYFTQGQTTTALDEVKLALAADPNLPDAYNLRGLIYARMGEEALADESFRRSLQLNPSDGDTLHNYGWFQCQRKQYGEAQKLFGQALALPSYRGTVRTLLVQGACRARAGQWPEAEQALSRAFELEPANPAVAVNLADVLYRRGDLERARFYIRRVNSQSQTATAETLWLAVRIENRAGNRPALQDLGTQLRNRFPQSREAAAYEQGQFDE